MHPLSTIGYTPSMPSLVQRLTDPVYRWLFPDPQIVAGSSGSADPLLARELYDARNALSAMAAFPWIMACLEVISTDLSGVPLVAVEEGRDGSRTILRDHPVLDLLRRPSPQASGVAMRRQLYADFAATREAAIRVLGRPGVDGIAVRLHPGDLDPVIDPQTGLITHYQWGDSELSPGEVLYIRGIGWERGIRSSRAESPVHALEEGLMAARDARRHARKSAQRGQIQMLLKPSDPVAQFGKAGVDAITDTYLGALRAGHGLFVLNRALDATPLSLSPRELEFSQLSTDVRDEVLAVFGVPPTMVGLPGANYGTARQQARQYWERRKHDARLFDDEFSRLTGDPRIRIEHDFTDVEALQTSRSERQMRASLWVTAFGVSPKDAAAYEGFDDAPIDPSVTAEEIRTPRPSAPVVEEPQESRSLGDTVAVWLAGAAERYQAIGSEGEIPDWMEGQEAMALAAYLIRAGLDPALAIERSKQPAAIVHESVRQYTCNKQTDGVLGIKALRVFGSEHAEHVARGLAA